MNRTLDNIKIALGFSALMAAVVSGFVALFWIIERVTGYTDGLFRLAGF